MKYLNWNERWQQINDDMKYLIVIRGKYTEYTNQEDKNDTSHWIIEYKKHEDTMKQRANRIHDSWTTIREEKLQIIIKSVHIRQS